MKKTLTFILLVLITVTLVAGHEGSMESYNRKGTKSVYAEVLGNGLFLTLNYERFLSNKFGIRLGGLLAPLEYGTTFIGTLMGTTVWGKGKLCLEGGLGATLFTGGLMELWTDSSASCCLVPTGTIGIRYQPKPKGILFRLDFTPMIFPSAVFPWIGVSIGYSF